MQESTNNYGSNVDLNFKKLVKDFIGSVRFGYYSGYNTYGNRAEFKTQHFDVEKFKELTEFIKENRI